MPLMYSCSIFFAFMSNIFILCCVTLFYYIIDNHDKCFVKWNNCNILKLHI